MVTLYSYCWHEGASEKQSTLKNTELHKRKGLENKTYCNLVINTARTQEFVPFL